MNQSKRSVTDELLDQRLAGYQKPEDLIGADGILKQLTKKLVERALDAELMHHLRHDKHGPASNAAGNARNSFEVSEVGLVGRPLRRLGRHRGAGVDIGKDKGARRDRGRYLAQLELFANTVAAKAC